MASDYVGIFANFVYTIFLASYLGARDFGTFTTIFTLLFFGGMVANFGIQKVIIRNVARNPEEAGIYFWNSIAIMTSFSFLCWLVIVLLSYPLGYSPSTKLLILLAGTTLLINGFGKPTDAILRAFERMEIPSLIDIILVLIGSGLGILLMLKGFKLFPLISLHVITTLTGALFLFYIVKKKFLKLSFKLYLPLCWSILRQSAPIAFIASLQLLSKRMDILMLSTMKGVDAVGFYGAALKITTFLWVPMQSLAQALQPYMASRLRLSIEALQSTYEKTVRLCILLSFPVVIVVFLLAKEMIFLLYGNEYVSGGTQLALKILIWAFFFDMISGPVNVVIINSEKQLLKFVPYAALLTFMNIGLNLFWIPKYGFVVASLSSLVCSIVGNGIKIWIVHQVFREKPKLFKMSIKPFLATAAMAGVIYFLQDFKVFLGAGLGALTYLLVLTILGEFQTSDLRSFRELLVGLKNQVLFSMKNEEGLFLRKKNRC